MDELGNEVAAQASSGVGMAVPPHLEPSVAELSSRFHFHTLMSTGQVVHAQGNNIPLLAGVVVEGPLEGRSAQIG